MRRGIGVGGAGLLLGMALTGLLHGNSGAAPSQMQLDQSQTVFSGGLRIDIRPSQTLTAGLHGKLVQIDVPLCTPIAKSRARLAIAEVDPPRRSASAVLTFAASYSDCAWYSFSLDKHLEVRSGMALRLTLSADIGKAPLWGSNAKGGDPYPLGAGSWNGIRIDDFAFRTYVDARAGH